jgi:hypothetical protein
MQQSCVDEDDAWELEQSLGLGSREILVVRVVEAVPLAVAVEEVRAGSSSYFANASRSKGRLRHDDVRLQGRRLHRPLHDPIPPGDA